MPAQPSNKPVMTVSNNALLLFATLTSMTLAASACARGTISSKEDSSGGAGSGSTTVPLGGAGGSLTLTLPTSRAGGAGGDANSGPSGDGAMVACTDGANCVCPPLSVAVVGRPGVWGDSSDTAFQDWLNSRSAGTAKVDNFLAKPAFTADFLAGYNLLILAGLGDNSNTGPWWTFSGAEVAAFQDWIENKGGGVISLAGYSNDSQEISAKNALLSFSGISYRDENFSPPCVIAKCHYECGNPAAQINEWNRTDPVIANLSLGVTMIGIDGGHPITAPADAHVAVMTTSTSTTTPPMTSVNNWLVGKLVGKGRVLVYADEWITYTSQWSGQSQNNDPSCRDFLPQQLYQTAQFWYNMIRWTQPNGTCFTIVNTEQPVTIW